MLEGTRKYIGINNTMRKFPLERCSFITKFTTTRYWSPCTERWTYTRFVCCILSLYIL